MANGTGRYGSLTGERADADDGSLSLSGTTTAGEVTPLLQSDAGSTATILRDETIRDPEAVSDDDSEDGVPAIGRGRAFALIMSMWALIFLQASNMSGMTMTQSAVAADLDAYEGAMWFTSSYLIATSSLAPIVGKLATIFSPASLVAASALFFAVGAVATSQATTFGTFIAARCLVGAGGAGIMTLALVLIIQYVSKKRSGLFIGLVNAGFTVGLSTGAIVYGALLEAVGWRALFYLQTPLALLGGIGVWFSLPRVEKGKNAIVDERTTWQKLAGIDYAGAATLTVAIVLFLYGLSGAIQPLYIAISVAVLAVFLAIEYRFAADPIIPISVLRSRGVLLSCVAQLGFLASRWTVLFYAPIFVLAVRGLPPAVAGAVLIPTNLGFGSGGLLVGWLHVRRGGSFWLPCLVSLALFGVTLLATGLVSNSGSQPWLYVLVVFANGLCTGAALNYTLAHLLHHAHPRTRFVAASLFNTFRGFAGSFGTTIGGGTFGRALRARLAEGFSRLDRGLGSGREKLIEKLTGSPALVFEGGLSDAERAVAVQGYEAALKTLYTLAAALTIFVIVVQAGTGWEAPVKAKEDDEVPSQA
ncbi:hypothetical protein RB597_003616 [Gaeumannomyces tritici]